MFQHCKRAFTDLDSQPLAGALLANHTMMRQLGARMMG